MEYILAILFVLILGIVYYLIKKKLNINLLTSKHANQIIITPVLLVGLLLIRSYISSNPFEFIHRLLIDKVVIVLILVLILRLLFLVLNVLEDLYSKRKLSLRRPLRPLFQILKIVFLAIFLFGIVAVVIDKDPLVVMGSISTIIAFISFIFKDILLGLFAGIQLTSSDTIRIGDSISIPNLDITGKVDKLSLVSVEIVPTNQTRVTVPAVALIQNPVINFRELAQGDGRQYVNAFNFRPNSEMNINNFLIKLRSLLTTDPQVHHEKLISLQIGSGPTEGLVLNVSFFSTISDYILFDQFSTQKSQEILQLMADHHLFKG